MSLETLKQLKVKHDWLFVKPIEDVIGGKIIIPDSAKEITQKGVLSAMGDKVNDKNLKLEDQILFRRRAAFKSIEIDGDKFLVMKPVDVLAVIFGEHVTDVSPTKDNVFIEWEVATEFYPGTAIKRPSQFGFAHYTGTVLAIGPDVADVVVGDRVFFDQFCGIEKFEEDGKRFGFVRVQDIYCSGVPERKEAVPA